MAVSRRHRRAVQPAGRERVLQADVEILNLGQPKQLVENELIDYTESKANMKNR